jgi:23S rRNA pseudouridine2605 synthase
MQTAMKEGLFLEDASKGGHEMSKVHSMEFAPFVGYRIIKSTPTYSTIKVVINEGKNRELRRFFGYFDAEVVGLKRVSYGKIDLDALRPGKHRFLSTSEYDNLRDYLAYTKSEKSDQ